MCYKGKCLYCWDVETGSLIFAIINLIIISLAGFLVLGFMVYFNIMLLSVGFEVERSGNVAFTSVFAPPGMVTNILLACVMWFIAVSMIFAILLTRGLITKNAECIKAFFVFGIVQDVIAFIIAIVLAFICIPIGIVLIIIAGCFIYSLILAMIYMTYTKILNGSFLQQRGQTNVV